MTCTETLTDRMKAFIVKDMFIGTADDNYVNARYSYSQNLPADFLWLSVHCLEKYMKAVLLLNGRPAKTQGHKIFDLYNEIKPLAPDLLPIDLVKHVRLGDGLPWRPETIERFIKELYAEGDAENRYLTLGYTIFPDAVFKLDMVVYAIRRLCRTLDDDAKDELRSDPTSWKLDAKGRLEEVAGRMRGDELRRTLLNCNPWFSPPDFRHEEANLNFNLKVTSLVRIIVDNLHSGSTDPRVVSAEETLQWVLDNIYISKRTKDLLVAECQAARLRPPPPPPDPTP